MINDLINNLFSFLKNASLSELAWLSVIAYAIHYAEEGPGLVAWFYRKNQYIVILGRKYRYTQKKLMMENFILFSVVTLGVILLNIYPDSWILKAFVLSHSIGFIINTFYHAVPTLKEKVYSPGVVTASSLFPLTFIIYFYKAAQLGILSWTTLLLAAAFGVTLLQVVMEVAHNIILRNDK